jgi:hypothetical protein
MKVQRRQCETCIFKRRYWTAQHLAALLDEIRDPRMAGFFKGYRLCHHSRDACCAGFWARHKDHFTAGQLAQRLGLVELVEHEVMTKLIALAFSLLVGAAQAEPLPQPLPPGGTPPHGWTTSGSFIVPRQGAQDAIPKPPNGTCPWGWTGSGSFCLRSGL